jgi:nucleoside 2-deoxyribosyltransferase
MTRYQRDFLVYLAGPISGLTYGEGQSWRDYAAKNLPVEIRAISPLRSKAVELSRVGKIYDAYEEHALTSTTGITTRDRFDCTRADAVLFNFLDAKTVSIGTCMELGWADALRIPIVLVIEKTGNLHDHPMVRGVAGFRVETLDQGLAILEAVLMPEGKGTTREVLPPPPGKSEHFVDFDPVSYPDPLTLHSLGKLWTP